MIYILASISSIWYYRVKSEKINDVWINNIFDVTLLLFKFKIVLNWENESAISWLSFRIQKENSKKLNNINRKNQKIYYRKFAKKEIFKMFNIHLIRK